MITWTGRARDGFILMSWIAALGGCSISMPGPALMDLEPTGSIRAKASANPIDARDWPIAEPAMRAVIRAEATAKPESWNNPETGRNGQFAAVASSFTRGGVTCRAFVAKIEAADGATAVQGVGCLGDGGKIAFSDIAPWVGL
jgi:hypothetical protein